MERIVCPWLRITSLVLLLTGINSGQAATLAWTNSAGGLWSLAANWSPNAVPGGADTAVITNAGTYTVTNNTTVTIAGLALGLDPGTNPPVVFPRLRHTGGTLTVTNLSVATNAVVTLTAPLTVAGVLTGAGQIDQPASTLRLLGTGTIGTYNLAGGEQRGGVLTITNFNWTNGNLNSDATGDRVIVPPGGVLNFIGNDDRFLSYYAGTGRGLDNHGTWNWIGSGSVRGNLGAVVNNYGAVNVTAVVGPNTQFNYGGSGGVAPVWNNFGTFTRTTGTSFFYFNNTYLNNSGTMDIQTGTLSIYNTTAVNDGNLNVAGDQLQITGTGGGSSVTNNGGIYLAPGKLFTMEVGSLALNAPSRLSSPSHNSVRLIGGAVYLATTNVTTPSLLISGATLYQRTNIVVAEINQSGGAFQLQMPGFLGNYNLTNGELRGRDLTVTNFNWYLGNLNSGAPGEAASPTADRLIIPAGGVLNFFGNTERYLSYWVSVGRSRGVDNHGTWNWIGSGDVRGNGAVVNNHGSVIVTAVVGPNTQFNYGGSGGVAPTWNNFGTFTRTTGTSFFYFNNAYLNNSGTMDIQTGALSIYNATAVNDGTITVTGDQLQITGTGGGSSVTNNGGIYLAPGKLFTMEVGSLTLTGPSVLSAPGHNSVRLIGGAVHLGTTNITTPSLLISGATLYQRTNIVVAQINQSGGSFQLQTPGFLSNYNLTNGELRGRDLTVTNFNWYLGNLNSGAPGEAASPIADRLIIPAGGVLNFFGNTERYLSYWVSVGRARGIDNHGTWNWIGSGLLRANGAVVNNHGAVIVTAVDGPNTQFLYGGSGGVAPTWNNFGTFTRTTGTSVFYFNNASLNNSGVVSIQSGALAIHNATATNLPPGVIQMAAGTVLLNENNSSTTISGGSTVISPDVNSIRLPSGAFYLASTNVVTPSLLISGGILYQQTNIVVSTINQSAGSFDLRVPALLDNYNLTNGELRGRDLTVTNFNWYLGNLNSGAPGEAASPTADRLIIPAGGVLNFFGNTERYLSYWVSVGRARGIDNHGTWNWIGSGLLRANGAVVNNHGAVIVTAVDGPNTQFLYGGSGGVAPIWNNIGSFTRPTGASVFYFNNASLNNSGVMDIQSGGLAIHNATATNLAGGSILLGANVPLLNENNAGTTLNPGSSIVSGSPNAVRVPSGTVYIRSTDLALPSLWISGGTVVQETNNVIPEINQSSGVWRLHVPVSVNTYNLTNGELRGADLTIENFNWLGGSLNADGVGSNLVTVATTLNISGNTAKTLSYYILPGRSLINNGTATWSGVNLTGQGGATLRNHSSLMATGDVALAWGGSGAAAIFHNTGTYVKSGGTGTASFSSTTITNSGTFTVPSGSINAGSFIQTGGSAHLGTNFNVSSTTRIEAGSFTGRGTAAGTFYNNSIVNPGASPGLIAGTHFTNSAAATLNLELGATNAPGTNYDQIRLTGAATLDGALNVSLWNNFAPTLSNRFTVMTFASRSGTFPTILPPPGLTLQADYSNTNLVLTIIGMTNAPLQITSFPADQTVYTSDPASFVVGVSGTTPISYQWQFNGNVISNATNASYNISSVGNTNAGLYTVLIEDGVGAQTNASATLAVIPFDGTIYWTNTAGGLWSVASNWLPNRVPGLTNHAVITNAGTYAVTVNSPISVGQLTLGLDAPTGQPQLNLYHSFTLEGPGNVGTNGVIDFNYQLLGAGSLTNHGTFHWGGGTLAGTGAFVNGTNGSVQTYANTYKYLNRPLNNFGGFNVSTFLGVQAGDGGRLTNEIGGRITLDAGQTGFSVQAGATNAALYNHGLITANGAPSHIYTPFFNEPDGTLLVNNVCYVGTGTNRGTINIPHPLAQMTVVAPTFNFEAGTALQGFGTITVGFSGALNLNAPVTCANGFAISAGQLQNPVFNVNANLTTAGTVSARNGDFNISPGVTLDAGTFTLHWFYQTYTHAHVSNAGSLIANNLNLTYGTFFNSGPITVRSNLTFLGGTLAHSGNGRLTTQTNSSTTIGQASTVVSPYLIGGVWDNYGTIGWNFVGILNVYGGAGLINHSNATMNLSGNGLFVNNHGTNWLVNYGLIQRNGFASTPALALITTNYNTVLLNNTAMWLGRYVQYSGQTDIGGGIINGAQFDIQGGGFSGAGTVQNGPSLNNAATLRPGSEIGVLTVDGPFTNAVTGVYHMQIAGNLPHQYDRLNVGDTARLAGTLNIALTNFLPTIGNTFTAMTYTARSGQFDNIVVAPDYQFQVIYTPTALLLLAPNAQPVVNLTVGATQLVCQPFSIQASASDPDGFITNLTVLVNGDPLAGTTGGPLKTSLETDFPQVLTLTARAVDNRGDTNSVTQLVEVTTLPLHELTLGGIRSNGFKICMLGETGSDYLAFATTNLNLPFAQWANLGLMENTNGIWRHFDAGAITNQPRRFYRALQQ